MNNIRYKYDVFISWTGHDKELKDRIKKAVDAKGMSYYDSEENCKGRFRDDFVTALTVSKVYLLILTDAVLNDPNVTGGYYSEVRREFDVAMDCEARGMLNVVVLTTSDYFNFNIVPDAADYVGIYFYSALAGYSRIRCARTEDGVVVVSDVNIEQAAIHAKEFVEARDKGKPVASIKPLMPLSTSEVLPTADKLIGREDVLAKIDEAFEGGSRIVVLTGIGGIGKTEVAKQYVNTHKKRFICPQMIVMGEESSERAGLKSIVFNCSFKEHIEEEARRYVREEQYTYKLNKLKELGENVILFVDNYNDMGDENVTAILTHLRCKVLLTTRVHEFEVSSNALQIVSVDKLCEDAARTLFGDEMSSVAGKAVFHSLYEFVGGHTMTLKIISKLMKTQLLTAPEMLSKLQEPARMKERVDYIHNNYHENETLLGHLVALFKMSDLLADTEETEESANTRAILRSMSLIGSEGMLESDLRRVLELPTANEILEIQAKGWLERHAVGDYDFLLTMHPLIATLIRVELKPTAQNCPQIVEYMRVLLSINEDASFSSVSKKRHIAAYFLSGLAKNGSYPVQLCSLYSSILLRLGEVGDVLREQDELIEHLEKEDAVAAAEINVDKAEVLFSSNINLDEAISAAQKAVGALRGNDPIKAWQAANMLAQQAYYRGSEDADRLLYDAFELALASRDGFIISSSFVIVCMTASKKNVARANAELNAFLRKYQKEYGCDATFYTIKLMRISVSIIPSFRGSGKDLISNISSLMRDMSDGVAMSRFKERVLNHKIANLEKNIEERVDLNDPSAWCIRALASADEVNDDEQSWSKFMHGILHDAFQYMGEVGIQPRNVTNLLACMDRMLLSSGQAYFVEAVDSDYERMESDGSEIGERAGDEWYRMGDRLYLCGNHVRAAVAYGNAYAQQAHFFTKNNFNKAVTLQQLGMCYAAEGTNLIACNYFKLAEKQLVSCLPDSDALFDCRLNFVLCAQKLKEKNEQRIVAYDLERMVYESLETLKKKGREFSHTAFNLSYQMFEWCTKSSVWTLDKNVEFAKEFLESFGKYESTVIEKCNALKAIQVIFNRFQKEEPKLLVDVARMAVYYSKKTKNDGLLAQEYLLAGDSMCIAERKKEAMAFYNESIKNGVKKALNDNLLGRATAEWFRLKKELAFSNPSAFEKWITGLLSPAERARFAALEEKPSFEFSRRDFLAAGTATDREKNEVYLSQNDKRKYTYKTALSTFASFLLMPKTRKVQ